MAELEDLNLTIKDLDFAVKRHQAEKGGGKSLVLDYEIKSLGEPPGGILSLNYIISVKLKEKRVTYSDLRETVTDNKSESSESEGNGNTFFVKCFPRNEFGIKYAQDLSIFRKERKLYEHLIPRLQDVAFCHEPWTGRCYFSKEDSVIILEDLTAEGFVRNNSTVLDLEHLKVALKALARMHSSSIALEERSRAEIPKLYPHHLDENAYPDKSDEGYRQTGVRVMIKTILKLVELMPKYYDDWDINEALEAFPEVINKIFDFVKPSTQYRNVFNQSDLWASNILFKYEEEVQHNDSEEKSSTNNSCELNVSKRPVDCRFIDFQFSRYAPPAYDIACLLTVSCSRDFREKHAKELLNIYYETLDAELSVYGFVTEDILPRSQFDASYEEYKLAGLIESLLFNQTIFLPVDFWTELTLSSEKFEDFILNRHTEICLEAFEKDQFYRTKIIELLRETMDHYVLRSEYDVRL